MLEKDNPQVSLKIQAELLGISYSSLFYQPVPPSERELSIKRRMDEVYTAWPFYGSRRITAVLRSEFQVSRPTVQAYMREMGIAGLAPGPNTSQPAPNHQIFPYLLRNISADHSNHIWALILPTSACLQAGCIWWRYWIGTLAGSSVGHSVRPWKLILF